MRATTPRRNGRPWADDGVFKVAHSAVTNCDNGNKGDEEAGQAFLELGESHNILMRFLMIDRKIYRMNSVGAPSCPVKRIVGEKSGMKKSGPGMFRGRCGRPFQRGGEPRRGGRSGRVPEEPSRREAVP